MKEAVFAFLLTVPGRKVVTYSQVAAAVGHPKAARAVGNILHQNPEPERYPCWRVVNSRGELSEHFAFGGLDGQKQRLEADGIQVIDAKVDLSCWGWQFPSL